MVTLQQFLCSVVLIWIFFIPTILDSEQSEECVDFTMMIFSVLKKNFDYFECSNPKTKITQYPKLL